MSILEHNENEMEKDIQNVSLMHLHRVLAHLHYDTIIRIDQHPWSGIRMTDGIRPDCLECGQGKHSKNQQSGKNAGDHCPIYVIGGGICSDWKGQKNHKDRLSNR